MSEDTVDAAEPAATMAELFASLPRWSRLAIGLTFAAECAVLAAGLTRTPPGEAGLIRIELPSARPAPGFSTL